jgi:hypothetical protein
MSPFPFPSFSLPHNFPLHHYGPAAWLDGFTMTRGGRPVTDQSQICHLLKFGPSGGQCGAETELWAHRGVSVHSGGSCTCRWPANLLTVDGADRVIAADSCHLHLKVFDTAGNLICRIGTWGNAETVPADGDVSGVGFHNIHGLAAAGDTLYVSDQDLRRIAKFRMAYRDRRTAPLPSASPGLVLSRNSGNGGLTGKPIMCYVTHHENQTTSSTPRFTKPSRLYSGPWSGIKSPITITTGRSPLGQRRFDHIDLARFLSTQT